MIDGDFHFITFDIAIYTIGLREIMNMKNRNEYPIKHLSKILVGVIIFSLLITRKNSPNVQASTETITLEQYHPGQEDRHTAEYYYELYPNFNHQSYKKFMKYTYKISDDSVIGIAVNMGIDFKSSILTEGKNGNMYGNYPYDVKVIALGPGTATLKVYDGKKLIDSYKFTVIADYTYSPSSFVNNTMEGENSKIDTLIKKFALRAIDSRYTTTNERILAALNAGIEYGGVLVSEKRYYQMEYEEAIGYPTVSQRLLEKIAIAEGYAKTNKAILNNLGFNCIVGTSPGTPASNAVELYKETENYEEKLQDRLDDPEEYEDYEEYVDEELTKGYFTYDLDFSATTKLTTEYDFSAEEADTIYKRTHLPAWTIGADTEQKVINVGQTISLSNSDMNTNTYSSDTSIVKAENGKITGVKPGIALVYRYNDTYCDIFYVLVNKKGSTKTVQTKINTKTTKLYFTSSDYAPYILGAKTEKCRIEDWDNLRIYKMEPIFGHGGTLKTKYKKGKIECYIEYDGRTDLMYTIGSSKFAY